MADSITTKTLKTDTIDPMSGSSRWWDEGRDGEIKGWRGVELQRGASFSGSGRETVKVTGKQREREPEISG